LYENTVKQIPIFFNANHYLQPTQFKYWVKGHPQQAEVAQRIPGMLRPRIFLTFCITRVVGRQPYTLAAFTPRRNPWYSFSGAESTPGHMVPSEGAMEKIP